MATRQTVIAIALTLTMVGAAGCAGWGVDGPADDGDEPDGGDELEDADGEAQADQGDGDGATDDDGHDDATDTGSDSADTGSDESGPDPHDSGIDDGTGPDDTDADANGDAGTGVDGGTGADDDATTDTGSDADSDPDADDADGVDDGNGDDGTDASDDGGSDTDSETHTLHVGIVDETAAGPVAGTVTVNGEMKDASADDGATFELEDGTYTVTGETKHDPESWHVEEREVTIDGEDEEVALSANPIRTLTVETNDAAHDVTLERHSDGATTTKTTDDDGSVEYSVVPGNYSIHADGYESADVTVPGDRHPDTVTLEPTDDGELATHTLRVTIMDATAAGGVEGTVTVDGETKETRPSDPAEFELEEGTYTVSGQHNDDWYVHDETVEIDDENVDLTLHTVLIYELTVDAGEPGVEVTVERDSYLSDETMTGTTGDDGTVTFDTILGNHTISAEGYETEEITVSGDFAPETVVLEPVDDGTDTRTLTVRVVDPNGEPVVGETVHLATYDGGADVANGETDEDGEVRFEIEDGDYEIAVSAPDKGLLQPSDDRLVTVAGEDTTRTIQLVSMGVEETERTLTVNVVDSDGNPIEGASIHATGPVLSNGVAHEPAGETNADGVATLAAYDGEYGLEAQHGDEIVQQDVTVDGDTETTVELPPDEPTGGEENTATGIVRVVDDDGEPIAGERVTLTPPATVQESAKEQRVTNDDGEVVIELAAGEPEDVVSYGVEVRGEEKSLAIMHDEHHGVQTIEFNPTNRMYAFETVIRVIDENGDPVEGVEVEARHGLLGPDDPANEWENVGPTDENGEVVLVGGSSESGDVIAQEVRVRDQTIHTSLEYERKVETIEIETDENENGTALARTGGPIVTPTPS